MRPNAEQLRIAELEVRVRTLEQALERRSEELRLIQSQVCSQDLLVISRIVAGLPPLPKRHAYQPVLWQETTELTPAEVEDVLVDLWRSLATPDSTPVEES